MVYEGFVKCKLVHTKSNGSLIFIDLFGIRGHENEFKWWQPINLMPCILVKSETQIICSVYVDVESERNIKIELSNNNLINNLPDDSSVYNCKIFGTKNMLKHFSGVGCFENNIPYVKLYHHTSKASKEAILSSNILRGSKYNIQGNKELKNISYFYLTSLDKIKSNADLNKIAMASNGKLFFLLDNHQIPSYDFDPRHINSIDRLRMGILEINVYRESTKNRLSTLEFLVDSSLLSPTHMLRHAPLNSGVYYEYSVPYISRIGMIPGVKLSFSELKIKLQDEVSILKYQIIGDATKFSGLEAPYEEEDTSFIFKIEKLKEDTNILEFWCENCNSDQFTASETAFQTFKK